MRARKILREGDLEEYRIGLYSAAIGIEVLKLGIVYPQISYELYRLADKLF